MYVVRGFWSSKACLLPFLILSLSFEKRWDLEIGWFTWQVLGIKDLHDFINLIIWANKSQEDIFWLLVHNFVVSTIEVSVNFCMEWSFNNHVLFEQWKDELIVFSWILEILENKNGQSFTTCWTWAHVFLFQFLFDFEWAENWWEESSTSLSFSDFLKSMFLFFNFLKFSFFFGGVSGFLDNFFISNFWLFLNSSDSLGKWVNLSGCWLVLFFSLVEFWVNFLISTLDGIIGLFWSGFINFIDLIITFLILFFCSFVLGILSFDWWCFVLLLLWSFECLFGFRNFFLKSLDNVFGVFNVFLELLDSCG